MSGNHLETPVRGTQSRLIAAEIAAISDINLSFLQILTHPSTRGRQQLLGLSGATLEALRHLSREQLQAVASSPLLLAEFSAVPGHPRLAEVHEPAPGAQAEQADGVAGLLESFAGRLLTCLWQAASHKQPLATYRIGLDQEKCLALASLSFTKISRYTDQAAGLLRARLADHPRFWTDLIRSVRSGNEPQQRAAQLAAIQLSILSH